VKPTSQNHHSGYPAGQLSSSKSLLFNLLVYAIQFAFFTRTLFMKRRKKALFMSRSLSGQSRPRNW
jgi:hypothetical protein